MTRTGRFRVRKTWFGKCILQEWCEWPGQCIGVAQYTEANGWLDVDWHHAPTELRRKETP